MQNKAKKSAVSLQSILIPLVLAQFVASYAGSNMNVAISAIANDLGTDVRGVQTAITLFTLTMAALMIPGSKLTDILGRKRCFVAGLIFYGIGALIATFSTKLGTLIFGYSLLEGIGSALFIPPVYILVTVFFSGVARAKAYGFISAAAGGGAAAGPLIGGLITSFISWRASFIVQILAVISVIIFSRVIPAEKLPEKRPQFDFIGAILSAAGLVLVVLGILSSGTYGWGKALIPFTIGNQVVIDVGGISPVWVFVTLGLLTLALFLYYVNAREKAGKTPLVSIHLLKNKTSNLGLGTQTIQWLVMQGSFFVISVFLQTQLGFSAIKTGVFLLPAIIGTILSSSMSGRLAQNFSQKQLIIGGFLLTAGGIILILLLASSHPTIYNLIPGLFFMGAGIGSMLTSSVNVVQTSFPEKDQGEISGISRSVSNLGSSLGTAIVGSILVSTLASTNKTYVFAFLAMVIFALVGLVLAILIPSKNTTRES